MASGGSLGSAQQETRIGGTGQSQGTGGEQGTPVIFFGPIFFHEGRKDRADRMAHVPGCETLEQAAVWVQGSVGQE